VSLHSQTSERKHICV